MNSRPMFVVQTYWVPTRGLYEVWVAADERSTRYLLVTRDPAIYNDALACEGHDVRIVATYHRAGGENVLDALAPAPSDAPMEGQP